MTRLARGHPGVALLLLTALGAAARFAALGTQSFGFDEAFTVTRVLPGGLQDMLERVSRSESSPPGYYVLAKLWTSVLGGGEAAIRSLSALLGTLLVPVAWALGRRVAGPRAGLVAGLLVAVNPMLIYYAQEARTYSLLALLATLSVLLALRARDEPKARRVALWACVSVAALFAHYFAAFVIFPAAVLLAIRARTPAVLAGVGGVGLVAVALLPLALRQSEDGRTDWISLISFPRRVGELPVKGMLGEYWFATPPAVLAVLAVPMVLAVALLALDRPRGRAIAPLLAVVAAALALPVATDAAALDVVNAKNMIAVLAPALVVVGAALASSRLGPAGPMAAIVLAVGWLALDVAVALDPGLQRNDFRGAAQALGPRDGPRAIVVPRGGSVPLEVYRPGVVGLASSAPVKEVVLLAPIARRRFVGADEPIPTTPQPPLPGFRLAQRTDADSYVLIRYVAPRAVAADPGPLLAARIGPPGVPAVYLER